MARRSSRFLSRERWLSGARRWIAAVSFGAIVVAFALALVPAASTRGAPDRLEARVVAPTRGALPPCDDVGVLCTLANGSVENAVSADGAARTELDPIPLLQAIARELVRARFVGTGGASGAVVRLHIQRTAKAGGRPLRLRVPLGTSLNNAAAGQQDMVVLRLLGKVAGPNSYAPTDLIELLDNRLHEYVLEAFCAEAHKQNPAAGGSLSIGPLSSSELRAVLQGSRLVPAAQKSLKAIQAAVWAVTDDISRSELAAIGYALTPSELRTARAIMTAGHLDWQHYRLFQGR